MSGKNPLEAIFLEITKALEVKLYWLALTSAVSIPGICAALEREDHWSGAKEYADWYNRYLSTKFRHLSAEDCYSIRCGIVHKATSGIIRAKRPYETVVFTTRDDNKVPLEQIKINGFLGFDVDFFCGQIIEVCRDWYQDHMNDNNVKSNIKDVFRYRGPTFIVDEIARISLGSGARVIS
jgi:hypothetical protein